MTFEEEGVGDRYDLEEIPGGIAVDSGASDNVMSKQMLKGFRIRPSPGSMRNQKWGSASGHPIYNEGEATCRFLTEEGELARGTTQVGEVKRPLAAVSKLTKAKKYVFFSEDENCVINTRDPLAKELLEIVKRIKQKTKLHEVRGTCRMRAWLVPDSKSDDKKASGFFARPGR